MGVWVCSCAGVFVCRLTAYNHASQLSLTPAYVLILLYLEHAQWVCVFVGASQNYQRAPVCVFINGTQPTVSVCVLG